jgi:hypothetical protein
MKSFILSLFVLAGAPAAHAGLLLEPYLGYHMGKWEFGSSNQDLSGVGYGARVGYQQMGLMVGGDLFLSNWTDDAKPTKFDWKAQDIAAFIGYNFPVLVRVYAAYVLDAELKQSGGGASNKYEGKGLKFGVGFTPLPLISINFELINNTYDEVNGNKMSTDLKSNMYGLTVSLPFVL